MKPDLVTQKDSWCLPSHIIVFLEKAIDDLDNRRLKLIPWMEFKKLIFDIIQNRVENAAEINGSINNTYMTLDEHLVCFTCTQGGPRFSKRDEIEKRLLDTLFSLKYYCQRWQRAKLYAEMLGFLKRG